MTEYTTPDFIFRIRDEDIDLTAAKHVYLTMKQQNYILTKNESDMVVSKNSVSVWFDQNEISKFKADGVKVEVQINWTYEDDSGTKTKRAATTIKSFRVTRNLLKKVLK